MMYSYWYVVVTALVVFGDNCIFALEKKRKERASELIR